MLELEYPWLLLLILVPLLLRKWLPTYSERQAAVRTPFFTEMARLTGRGPTEGAVVRGGPMFQRILVWVSAGLLVVAAARPRLIEEPIVETRGARDLLLAVDLSQSMETNDFVDEDGAKLERLTAVKRVLVEFIDRRMDDRIGLVFFGSAAFVQAPFTQDHEILLRLLDEASAGMAGPKTVLGEAIGLAVKVFEEREAEQRVLVLLTDGNDSGSKIPPVKAAEIAGDHGITIFPIGAGDPQATGEAPLDEETLGKIATTTGGRFFRAEKREDLAAAYDELDAILPREVDSISFQPTRPLYFVPVLAVLLLALGYHGAMLARRRSG